MSVRLSLSHGMVDVTLGSSGKVRISDGGPDEAPAFSREEVLWLQVVALPAMLSRMPASSEASGESET